MKFQKGNHKASNDEENLSAETRRFLMVSRTIWIIYGCLFPEQWRKPGQMSFFFFGYWLSTLATCCFIMTLCFLEVLVELWLTPLLCQQWILMLHFHRIFLYLYCIDHFFLNKMFSMDLKNFSSMIECIEHDLTSILIFFSISRQFFIAFVNCQNEWVSEAASK